MAELNFDYDAQNGQYSDGDIENRMLEMAENGISYEDLPEETVEFPLIYHFDKIRENILNWYPFTKEDTVLEIGAGCGALTGMLSEKAGRVTAVELSSRRAAINYERHKACDNLCIMVGNLNDMKFPELFDYIILNGVLEYAMSFTDGETPYQTFLEKISNFLKPDGKLLVAIENRLGLKYFAGAPEDHTDLYFLGINQYEDNKTVRTFSKTELTRLFQKSGLSHLKYYYPYPDYKFPTEIFTDETLRENGYGRAYSVYTENRFELFNEAKAAHSLLREGVMDSFVNSFLVEASRQELKQEREILYAKINSDRNEKFRIMTLIVKEKGELRVIKRAMNDTAKVFLKKMENYGKQEIPSPFVNLPCHYRDGEISYEFLESKTYYNLIKEFYKEGDKKSIENLFISLYKTYFKGSVVNDHYQTPEFQNMFGNTPGNVSCRCICPANIDLICQNIFYKDGESTIIDYEWVAEFPVPIDFIMWRLLNEIYSKLPELNHLYPRHIIFEKLGISLSDQEVFLKWAIHFAYTYVGSEQLSKYAQNPVSFSMESAAKEFVDRKYLDSKLYYDLGQGLNEDQVVRGKVRLYKNRFKITFDLKDIKGIKGLRWNPADGKICKCRIDRVDSECRTFLVPQEPYITVKDKDIFGSRNANYIISALDGDKVSRLVIEGKIWYLDTDEIAEIFEKMMVESKAPAENILEIKEVPETPNIVETVPIRSKVKNALRPFVNKIRRSEIQKGAELLYCLGNVDYFIYEDKILSVIGWIFDSEREMLNPRIAYYRDKEKLTETAFQTIYRKDVADNIGNPKAEASGFSATVCVNASFDIDVYYEFDTEEGLGGKYLGTVSADPDFPAEEEPHIYTVGGVTESGDIRYFKKYYVTSEQKYPEEIFKHVIDIIVPVYNGLQYFDKLFSGVEKTWMSYRLIIIDDCSPDPQVKEYLEEYAQKHSEVILVRNETNLGFLKSVNKGLKMAKGHTVLLNTDVEVPEQWLERLMLPIICHDKVATSTPYTTCGTLCSFPNFCEDNVLFEKMRLWQIDDEFRTIQPRYPSMPTGIGFCMGLNYNAMQEIGYLDEENFGKGYGEENDWCQRAVEAGYRNVHVDNLFVYHKHGGSFLSEEKMRLLEEHSVKLLQKHPNYNRDVAEYCRRDPLVMVRQYVTLQLLNKNPDIKTIVAFDHNLGGGATEYLNKKVKEELQKTNAFITIRYDIYTGKYLFCYQYKSYKVEFFSEDLEDVLNLVRRVDEIWINELVTYQGLYKFMKRVVEWKKEHQAVLRMLLHDFFCICPAVNLMDKSGVYCEVADTDTCNSCIPDNKSNACLEYESGSIWRREWREFLLSCDEIYAFSDDTAKLFRKAYPDVYRLHVIPHEPHYLPAVDKKYKTTKTLNIGLLGVLCYKKGLDVVKQMIKVIEEKDLNIRIRLIGECDEEIESAVFSCTGRYTREMLPRLTMQEDIDIFLIPSIWPETFSYTTSEIMSMKMPVAVFNIGAPVERVEQYERGIVLHDTSADSVLYEIQKFADEKCGVNEMRVSTQRILFLGEEISFASRYRVEHLREQLIFRGYASDFYQVNGREEYKLENYSAIVFYRCSDESVVKSVTEEAKILNLPVYYDIDDLIFDYDKIAALHFLEGEEYKDFKNTTLHIHKCMELCGGYLTSTNTLAREISREFAGKPVVINRNTASMEMQILSHEAIKNKKSEPERIYIGYFSGSKTHDKDFSIVEDALIKIMEKYPQVYLKLVGVLSEDKLKRFQNRIEKQGFMEWQKLPQSLAEVDINLMPLEDTVFHCSKSENKWMEAALVKVPSVMSRNAEMELVIENGVNGFLCSSCEEWYCALDKLILDKSFRMKMGECAHIKVMNQYVTQKTGEEAIHFLTGVREE